MIDKTKIVIRNAKETDNVNQIAKLIYSSDLNIYGAMFENEINACKVMQKLIHSNTINISIRNLIVAAYGEDIVGILCFIKDNYFDDRVSYKSAFEQLNLPLPQHFDGVFDAYWKKIISENFSGTYYISNVAVDSSYQNLGIGKGLLGYFIETHSDKPIGLDVVQDNVSAIHA
ncbi:MAG: GNAT family N-acetyltransferase, partial [Oscillospiraceae bacterium]